MAGDIRFGDGLSYFGPNLTIAVLNGTVPQWRLDDMVVRILAGWYLVGGDTDVPHPNFQSWTPDTFGPVHAHVGSTWGTGLVNQHVDVRREHGRLIREIGGASTVLLKNTRDTLPLNNTARLTAVFGEDAGSNPLGPNGCRNHACDVGTIAVGWGSGQASSPYLISPDAAIQHEVVSRYGSYESITNNSAFTQINALARRVRDVAGVCIVLTNAGSGEGFANVDGNLGDRKNLTLWQGADAVIANVSATCNNTVLVIHSVGAVEIDQYKENPNITAILWAGLPGKPRQPYCTSIIDQGEKVNNQDMRLQMSCSAALIPEQSCRSPWVATDLIMALTFSTHQTKKCLSTISKKVSLLTTVGSITEMSRQYTNSALD